MSYYKKYHFLRKGLVYKTMYLVFVIKYSLVVNFEMFKIQTVYFQIPQKYLMLMHIFEVIFFNKIILAVPKKQRSKSKKKVFFFKKKCYKLIPISNIKTINKLINI